MTSIVPLQRHRDAECRQNYWHPRSAMLFFLAANFLLWRLFFSIAAAL